MIRTAQKATADIRVFNMMHFAAGTSVNNRIIVVMRFGETLLRIDASNMVKPGKGFA